MTQSHSPLSLVRKTAAESRQPAHAPEYLLRALEAATHAPSVHNTQPWRFRISEDQAGGLVDLYADRERSLAALDPTGRQLGISCGAALLFLRVALRAAGFDAEVTLLPDQDPDHLATVRVRQGSAPNSDEQRIASAVAHRHSQRSAFQSRAVAPDLLTDVRRAAEAEGAWLALLSDRDDQLTLITLLSRADREEARDPAYLEELRAWLRTDPSSSDGIPVDALPVHDERHSEVAFRDFNPGRIAERLPEPRQAAPVDERPALVVLGTAADTPADHLTAGMALGRLLLQASAMGLSASILGQVIDLPGPRARLRSELGLVGEPQIVLRLGYGSEQTEALTGRRAVTDVLLT